MREDNKIANGSVASAPHRCDNVISPEESLMITQQGMATQRGTVAVVACALGGAVSFFFLLGHFRFLVNGSQRGLAWIPYAEYFRGPRLPLVPFLISVVVFILYFAWIRRKVFTLPGCSGAALSGLISFILIYGSGAVWLYMLMFRREPSRDSMGFEYVLFPVLTALVFLAPALLLWVALDFTILGWRGLITKRRK